MLSRRLRTILPPQMLEESLETTRIFSAAGKYAAARDPARTHAPPPAKVGCGTILLGSGSQADLPKAGQSAMLCELSLV